MSAGQAGGGGAHYWRYALPGQVTGVSDTACTLSSAAARRYRVVLTVAGDVLEDERRE